MSSSDEEELLLLLALICKRTSRRWWMHEINEKRERLGVYHLQLFFTSFLYSGWPVSYKKTYSRTFSIIFFSTNSSAIPYCPPGKFVSKTQMSAARRDLDWSAASARLLFDGDDAVLHNTVRTPSRRGSPLSVCPNTNWLGFITEKECVYCAVRTGSLNVIQANLIFQGLQLPFLLNTYLF